ncbi:response regulator [Spirosoma luteolum]
MNQRHHILHVDDDLYIRKIIHHTLKANFDITGCIDGVEAMAWLEAGNEPDIILTDLNMPGMDGKDFISMIRLSAHYRHVPIVVLSGQDDTFTKIDCINMGADDFIIKPFNPLEVIAKLNALLRWVEERRSYMIPPVPHRSER